MSTGPEHYAAAERLLERADFGVNPELVSAYALRAQVHATLALAAATAIAVDNVPLIWQDVLGVARVD